MPTDPNPIDTDDDLDELYQELIMDHGRRPRNTGALPQANCHARGHNPLCGDELTLAAFVEAGLPAIEVFHPDHTQKARERYQRFATAHGLLVTGGSDFHGDPEHGRSPGCCSLPPAAWQALQSRLAIPTS